MSSTTPRRRSLWADRPLALRIASVGVIGLLGTLVVGTVGIARMADQADRATELRVEGVTAVAEIGALETGIQQVMTTATADLWVPGDVPGLHEGYLAGVEQVGAGIVAGQEGLVTEQSRAVGDRLVAGWEAYVAAQDEALAAKAAGNLEQAGTIYEQRQAPAIVEINEAMGDLRGMVLANADLAVAAAQSAYETGRAVVIIVVVITGALSLGLAWFVGRGIARPVGEVVRVLDAVADGDLTQEITVHSRDEIGQMADSLRTAQTSLRGILSGVAEASQTIAAASEELSASGSQVSAGSAETSAQAGVVAA
uniref:HAMP domain-containing protein n=1 Tax=Actinotalea sp. C106 TaxID=2908644 RepID=UPI0020278AB0